MFRASTWPLHCALSFVLFIRAAECNRHIKWGTHSWMVFTYGQFACGLFVYAIEWTMQWFYGFQTVWHTMCECLCSCSHFFAWWNCICHISTICPTEQPIYFVVVVEWNQMPWSKWKTKVIKKIKWFNKKWKKKYVMLCKNNKKKLNKYLNCSKKLYGRIWLGSESWGKIP